MNQEENIAVEILLNKYSNALNSSNAQLLTSLYVSDGVFIPDLGPTIRGEEEIRHSAVRFFEQNQINIAFEVKDIVFKGDLAFVQATSTCTVQQRLTGSEIKKTAKDFFVLQKEHQQWKVFRYMFNS